MWGKGEEKEAGKRRKRKAGIRKRDKLHPICIHDMKSAIHFTV
jgi:hypothetical protein